MLLRFGDHLLSREYTLFCLIHFWKIHSPLFPYQPLIFICGFMLFPGNGLLPHFKVCGLKQLAHSTPWRQILIQDWAYAIRLLNQNASREIFKIVRMMQLFLPFSVKEEPCIYRCLYFLSWDIERASFGMKWTFQVKMKDRENQILETSLGLGVKAS